MFQQNNILMHKRKSKPNKYRNIKYLHMKKRDHQLISQRHRFLQFFFVNSLYKNLDRLENSNRKNRIYINNIILQVRKLRTNLSAFVFSDRSMNKSVNRVKLAFLLVKPSRCVAKVGHSVGEATILISYVLSVVKVTSVF